MRLHDVSKSSVGQNTNVLSETQLQLLQRTLLLILDDLNQICEDNGLRFILIGGSAIGAMRHKGFIPWDDDVDIAMPRVDYEKLRSVLKEKYNKKYVVSDAQDKDNYGKIIPKIRLDGTVYKTILDTDEENPGVRIDVFIIENTFNNFILRNIHGIGCYFFGFALACRRLFYGWEKYRRLSDSRILKIKAYIGRVFSFASLETWARWTDCWYRLCKDDCSRFVSVPSDGPHFYKGLTKRENLCDRKEIEFEGRKLYVPKNVHQYLTGIYGNYMSMPPESKRVRGKYVEFDLGMYDGQAATDKRRVKEI